MTTNIMEHSSPCRTSVVARRRRVAQEMPLHAGNVSHAAHVISFGESFQVVEQLVGVDAKLGQFFQVEWEVIGGCNGRYAGHHDGQ